MVTLDDLEEHKDKFIVNIDRTNIQVYVLDDEGFDMDPLYKLGYKKITKCMQFEEIDRFKEADIILCDIEGIGGSIDPIRQGVAVAHQIKSVYPNKIVLLYSGKNIETFGEIPNNIDGYIRKQNSMAELADTLDNYYRKQRDVILIWKNLKEEMQRDEITAKTIAFMEHYYCKSLLDGINFFNEDINNLTFGIDNVDKFISRLAEIINIFLAIKGALNV